jgi:hypothetical protein
MARTSTCSVAAPVVGLRRSALSADPPDPEVRRWPHQPFLIHTHASQSATPRRAVLPAPSRHGDAWRSACLRSGAHCGGAGGCERERGDPRRATRRTAGRARATAERAGAHAGVSTAPPASQHRTEGGAHRRPSCSRGGGMSVVVWVMVGMAIWHFTVLVPDRSVGGSVGAFLAAVTGAIVSGYLLPSPGVPAANPPGVLGRPGPSRARCWRWPRRTRAAPGAVTNRVARRATTRPARDRGSFRRAGTMSRSVRR